MPYDIRYIRIMNSALVILLICSYGAATKPNHPDVRFLGIGYNIVEGNPGGSDLKLGGLDPGLKSTRPIIKLSYEGKLSDDREYIVPDEVVYTNRDGSAEGCTVSYVYGSRSYQEELKLQVDVEGSGLAGFEFGASAAYRAISEKLESDEKLFATTNTLEIYGEGRILSASQNVSFGEEFASDLCALPHSYSGNEMNYHQFLDNWGTHVVTHALFGRAMHTFVEYQQSSVVYTRAREIDTSVSIEGAYKGYSGSISISASHSINFREVEAAFDGTTYTTTRGSSEQNEPIKYTLVGMDQILDDGYIIPNPETCSMETLKQNIQDAMEGYPAYKGIQMSSDPDEFRQPLTWPDGTYTLPMTSTGCPEGGVSWANGSRLFDTEDNNPENSWDPEDIHLNLPIKELSRVEMTFCTKRTPQSADFRRDWQSGTYCIYKFDDCPRGFEEGSIIWDDNDFINDNKYEGTVPDGDYDHNTKMYFCCRTDAEPSQPIVLPVDHEFMLLTPTGTCQQVFGMNVAVERFHWDSEGHSQVDGVYPYPGLKDFEDLRDVEIIFCYYQRDTNPSRKRRSGSGSDEELCDYLKEIPNRNPTAMPGTMSSPSISFRVNLLLVVCLTCFVVAVNNLI